MNVNLSGASRVARPLVSVGLVTFNRAGTLPRAIASVLSQDYSNFELLIYDDASADGTQCIGQCAAAKDRRVRYVRHQTNIGMTANFVAVLRAARGELFMWLSDDDWLGPHYIAQCVQELTTNRRHSVVCGVTRFYEANVLTSRSERIDLLGGDAASRVVMYYRNVRSNVVLYGVVWRELLLRIPYTNTFGADLLVSASLACAGTVKTLESTYIGYSVSGISSDSKGLALYYGFSKRAARNPYRRFVYEAVVDIWCRSPVYQRLSHLSRFLLCARVVFVLRERFVMPRCEARIRGAAKLRTRLRRLQLTMRRWTRHVCSLWSRGGAS